MPTVPTTVYKLANVAYPGRYVSLVNGNIVGHSEESGVMIEWFAEFHEGGLITFQAVRDGKVCDEYIYFDYNTRSLTCSENRWLFAVKEGTTASSSCFSIGVHGSDEWWTLTSSDENSPVKIQRSIDSSIEQLWKFEKWMSSSV